MTPTFLTAPSVIDCSPPPDAAVGVGSRLGAEMSLEQDVATARRAVDALERACVPVTRRFGDTVDSRRLRVDLARLRDDLNLLCGVEPGRAYGQPYPAAWDGGFDGTLDAPTRTAP